MTTFIRSVFIAVAVLSSVSAVSARTSYLYDENKSASQLDFNNPDDVKAFWEFQSRGGY